MSEKLLRAPGEGLRRELERIDEQVMNRIFVLMVVPLVTPFLVLKVIPHPLGALVGSGLIFLGSVVWMIR